ncbi:hypothetical protein EDD16DRAFT_527886 [Pisolithus croceorrhizus]|nr:hypothetical protein EDD16DRAFT_527886 [Pisolithus croceorrhizus]KAI6131764.1 hypothetical protein EV401DRAFT_378052 [Pisolithus croceorrhizus]KAI6162671.1 hypothetical protein EDD17DRAFT_538653 [Pisolithus thermaeus]
MQQLTYLLIQQSTVKLYAICGTRTAPDRSDSNKVETLLVGALAIHAVAAVRDFMGLDSDQEVEVRVFMLLEPVGDFGNRSLDDIANELGSIDQQFLATKVARLPPYHDIWKLGADVKIIVAFDVCSPTRQSPFDAAMLVDAWTNNRRGTRVPAIEELHSLLEMPLARSEKIPITDLMFAEFLYGSGPDRCDVDDVGSLFRVGEPCPGLAAILYAVDLHAPGGGTKADFISFWYFNIRRLFELAMPNGRSFSDGERRTKMRKSGPDFRFMVNGSYQFRGQERGSDDPRDPKEDLSNNFTWTYGPAPYAIGYYCHGSKVTLAAIAAPPARGGKSRVQDIVSVDLKLRKDRIANVRHIINLAPILSLLASLCPPVKKGSWLNTRRAINLMPVHHVLTSLFCG